MKITTRTNCSLCEITIETDNLKIKTDVGQIADGGKRFFVDKDIIENFTDVVFDLNAFSGISAVDTVKNIINLYLTDNQKQIILEELIQEQIP